MQCPKCNSLNLECDYNDILDLDNYDELILDFYCCSCKKWFSIHYIPELIY